MCSKNYKRIVLLNNYESINLATEEHILAIKNEDAEGRHILAECTVSVYEFLFSFL